MHRIPWTLSTGPRLRTSHVKALRPHAGHLPACPQTVLTSPSTDYTPQLAFCAFWYVWPIGGQEEGRNQSILLPLSLLLGGISTVLYHHWVSGFPSRASSSVVLPHLAGFWKGQSELKEQTPRRFKKIEETKKTYLACKDNAPSCSVPFQEKAKHESLAITT